MALQRSRRSGLAGDLRETRHMRAMLKAQINKTDRNDARGIAQMMRVGFYRPVHVKTLRSQKRSAGIAGLLLRRSLHGKAKDRSTGGSGLYRDPSTVRFDNGATDGQAHTHAMRLAGNEWLEQL
jgi:hypothetical protein